MVVSNRYDPDPRVHKEAQTLVAAGHSVTVLPFNRMHELPSTETRDERRSDALAQVIDEAQSRYRDVAKKMQPAPLWSEQEEILLNIYRGLGAGRPSSSIG